MKISTATIASLRFTTGLLITIFFWFAAFIPLTKMDGGRKIAAAMNHSLLLDWFQQDHHCHLSMKIWVVGLCLLTGLLALNLTVCTWRRFSRSRGLNRRKWLLFLIHLIFGLLVAAHGAGFFWGWKPEPITAHLNNTIQLGQYHHLKIEKIVFRDNPLILMKPHRTWTSTDFNYRLNQANISLSKGGSEIVRGEIATYRPLRKGSLQITLLGFIPPLPGASLPGIRVQVSRAPFARPVIWLFHTLIFLTLIYFITTMKVPAVKKQS